MNKLVITEYKNKILQARYENGKLSDIFLSDKSSCLGNIYVGKVANIIPNINACFVDYGEKLPCYYSLDDNKIIYADTKEHKKLKVGDEIVLQISKEAVKTKNPVGSSELSLRGDYCLVGTCEQIGVSGKITNRKLREELKACAKEVLPENMGCIIRTQAANVEVDILKNELKTLSQEITRIIDISKSRTCFSCLYKTMPDYIENIVATGSRFVDEIVTDVVEIYDELIPFVEQKGMTDMKVSLYDDSKCPLKAVYNMEKELENALRERVWLKSGAYLVIQQTEAMVVVDVNTGKAISGKDMEAHMLSVNREAAIETCRQLRLRNLSGIIIIDFINMKNPADIYEIRDIIMRELERDPVPAKFVDITKLGLIELTRKKIKKPLHEILK
jgi:ribonuclease G